MATYMKMPFPLDKPSATEWVTEADKIEYEDGKSVKDKIDEIKDIPTDINTIEYVDVAPTKYVDLGLPSGLKWAKCNLGAETEEGYGLYFQWGDIEGRTADEITDKPCDWAHAPFNNGSSSYNSNYFIAHKSEWLDGDILKPEYDAATQNMGADWRMPTKADYDELLANTTNEWVTGYNGSGINGRLYTSKTNGNTLFIPAAGSGYNSSMSSVGTGSSVWSSSFNKLNINYAYHLRFSSSICDINHQDHCRGFSVRPVYVGNPGTLLTYKGENIYPKTNSDAVTVVGKNKNLTEIIIDLENNSSGGTTYEAGTGIDIIDNTISVKESSIDLNNCDNTNAQFITSTDLQSIEERVSSLENDVITEESDPVFTSSVAYNITEDDISNWNNKSDFDGSYDSLSDTPNIPTSTSELNNDSGYITSSDLSDYATSSDLSSLDSRITTIENTDYITSSDNRFTTLQTDYTGLSSSVTDLQSTADDLKSDIDDLKSSTETLEFKMEDGTTKSFDFIVKEV